jgi:hypothetical protein
MRKHVVNTHDRGQQARRHHPDEHDSKDRHHPYLHIRQVCVLVTLGLPSIHLFLQPFAPPVDTNLQA